VTLEYDELVVCLGTRMKYALVPGMREHSIPFKYLGDALRLRNEAVRALEEADTERDPVEKTKLLTFVVGGGGFSGVECVAELNDFLTAAIKDYSNIRREEIRCVLLQSADRILPELGESLALYAQNILANRGVEIRLNTRLKAVSADSAVIQEKDKNEPERIDSRTIVSTVPAAAHPLVKSLPFERERDRIVVTKYLDVPKFPGHWALGDCASVPQIDGIKSPPTAQHALRQAKTCATNIVARMRGNSMKQFSFTGLGKLASLGQRSAVAEVFGIKITGILAWFIWRTIYLLKFPGLDRKLRIAADWTLDLILPRDITQLQIFPPEHVQQEYFHAGENIFDQGDFGNKFYVLAEGEAEIVKDGIVVATIAQGAPFGEIALVENSPRTAGVRAKTNCTLVSVARPAFKKLLTHLPGVRDSVEGIMANHGVDPSGLDVPEEDDD
jgi:NADH dehydrogenase